MALKKTTPALVTGLTLGLSAAEGLAVNILLSRYLGFQEFGVIVSVLSIANIAAMLPGGQEHATQRYGLLKQGPSLSRIAGRQALIAGTTLMVGGALLALEPELGRAALVGTLFLVPHAFVAANIRVAAALYRRNNSYRLTYAANAVFLQGPRLAAAITLGVVGKRYLSLQPFLIAVSAVSVVAFFLVVLPAYRRHGGEPLSSSRQESSEWNRFALNYSFHASAQALFAWIDVPLVAVLMSPAAAGKYAFATRLALGTGFFVVGIGTWYSTQVSRQEVRPGARNDHYYREARAMGLFVSVLLSAAVLGLAPTAFRLANQDLDGSSYLLLSVILVSTLLDAAFGPNSWALGFSGNAHLLARIEWLVVVLSVTLLFLLVPVFGFVGAVLARATATQAGNVMRSRYLRHYERRSAQSGSAGHS